MTAVEGSKEAAIERAPFAHKLWINSPFMICRETIDGVMMSRKLLGHKLYATIMPVSGASSPITVSGAIVQEIAEVIAANIISLALDDHVIGYCSSTNSFDFTANIHCQHGPEANTRRFAGFEMNHHMFGEPLERAAGVTPGTTAAVPGIQSVMEKCIDMTTAVMAGQRSFTSAGLLSQADVASPIQLLLDVELMDYLNFMLKPFNTSDAYIGEENIVNTVPLGAKYIESEHTFEYFREEVWFPRFIDRRTANTYMKDPDDMMRRAERKALQMIEESPNQCPLNDAQKAEIRRILDSADRNLG